MARRILSYCLLMLTVAWLILSYVPASVISLPQISAYGNSTWFGSAALLVLVSMALLQVGLLGATARFVRAYRAENQRSATTPGQIFHLKLISELFWTFVPLLIVLILGLLSFSIWGAA